MRSYRQRYYRILREGVDFYDTMEGANGGTRAKKIVRVRESGRKAIFKFDNGKKFRKGEDCSEKLASEFAKILRYPVVDVDLAVSVTGEVGLLSYFFVDKAKGELHEDAEFYLAIDKTNEKDRYTIRNMKNEIGVRFPEVNFEDFLRIMFFDALVGERDRHVGNWGIMTKDGRHSISPMYDTANCLLTQFQDTKYRKKKLSSENGFRDFVNKNKLAIYVDDDGGNYSPTSMVVDYMLDNYLNFTLKEIKNLRRLKDNVIKNIVYKIPKSRMDDELKSYIIEYLKIQRDDIIGKGEKYGS